MALPARPCPSCGVLCEGMSGGTTEEILGRGRVETAVRSALEDSLRTSAIPEFLFREILSAAVEYRSPFVASWHCRACARIHAGESLVQRHHRCLLHIASGRAYRAVKIGRTIYVRGNESIVGMEYGAKRAQPEGDLKRLEALTRAAAAGIARAVTGKVDELYDTQDPRADTSLLAELMLKGDHLVWNLRRQIDRCAMAPFGALPAGSHHIEVPRAVIPPASAPPPLPDIPENAPPAATVVHEPLSRRKPPVPGGASLASRVGSLKRMFTPEAEGLFLGKLLLINGVYGAGAVSCA